MHLLRTAMGLALGYIVLNAPSGQIQVEPAWQINASQLQAAGLSLPANMPRVGELMLYQVKLATHQELTIEWNLIPSSENPVRRERVAEGSLNPEFILVGRKQNVQGSARTSTLTLSDMTLVTTAITAKGEIRGLTVGPGSSRIPVEYRNGKGGLELVYSKVIFEVFLPDDPKIEKLVFLLSHPDGPTYRLEQVGTLALPSASH